MKISNLTSIQGNKIANQFRIVDNGCVYFQSYDSIICKRDRNGQLFLDSVYWKYSPTTSKYRAIFLGESTKETQAKIDSGEYKLVDLN